MTSGVSYSCDLSFRHRAGSCVLGAAEACKAFVALWIANWEHLPLPPGGVSFLLKSAFVHMLYRHDQHDLANPIPGQLTWRRARIPSDSLYWGG